MTYSRMPRDDGDDDQVQGPRRAGRVVPMQPPEHEPTLIAITVGGVQFGTIYPQELRARAQIDLERVMRSATPTLDMLAWCERYAGVDRADLPELEDALAEMPLGAVVEFAVGIQQALGQAMQVPKARPPR